MALTDTGIKALKPRQARYRVTNSANIHLSKKHHFVGSRAANLLTS